jgi:hypothetical protein
MVEIFEKVVSIYLSLAKIGINMLAIGMTILLVNFLKKYLNGFQFYNKKTSSIINIVLGAILSFGFALLFFSTLGTWNNIFISTIIGAGLSVYSREIMDAVFKIIKKDKLQ